MRKSNSNRVIVALFTITTIILPEIVSAATTMDLKDLFNNLLAPLPAAEQFILAVCAIVGVFSIAYGTFNFKKMGFSSGMQQRAVENPFVSVAAGVALMYFATVVGIGGNTLFGTTEKATDLSSLSAK